MNQIKQAGQSYPFIVKKSKFIASIAPVRTEQEAQAFIQKIQDQHRKANHNCYAYRIVEKGNIIVNESDEGEPSGTAGQPILYVLEKRDIVNTIVVVSRYFGGVKLGKGGLVRSYSKVTSNTINNIGLMDFR